MLVEGIPAAVIEPDCTRVIDYGGVKGHIFQHRGSIGIAHIAIIAVFPVRGVADGNADALAIAAHALVPGHTVIEIKPAVIALHHIRGIHIFELFPIQGVLAGTVRNALAAPFAQIIHKSRPEFVVQHTIGITRWLIVGTKQIDPVAKDMRLSVCDTGIQRQKWVRHWQGTPFTDYFSFTKSA